MYIFSPFFRNSVVVVHFWLYSVFVLLHSVCLRNTRRPRLRPSECRCRSQCPQATTKYLQKVVYDGEGCLSQAREMSGYPRTDRTLIEGRPVKVKMCEINMYDDCRAQLSSLIGRSPVKVCPSLDATNHHRKARWKLSDKDLTFEQWFSSKQVQKMFSALHSVTETELESKWY